MAKTTDEKYNILEAIKAFAKDDISKAGINLFATLGYDTSLQAPLDNKSFAEFNELYIQSSPYSERFNEERANVHDWKSIDILFQLTDDSFSSQGQLFDSKLNPYEKQSYLCFAVELNKAEYTKTQVSNITREINKLFAIPILVIFKYGECLTLAVINRRVNKRDSDRDVLEKVTLIKDIRVQNPHRAHVEILADMSLPVLSATYDIHNFETLHKAWSEVLDTQTLNKRFYTELSNWYFWAIKTVVYPGYQMEADKNGLFSESDKIREHNAKNLIRLLTRLLFVWFIKEKDLIPEEFFDESKIRGIITGFKPEYNKQDSSADAAKSSIYYKAILQNLFFASLNAEQGNRKFRIDGQNQNATSLMRYKRYHKAPDVFVKTIEEKVPFMNGGLFECLDHQDDELKGKRGGAIVIYEDGFSDRNDNDLFVPDYIFFGKEIKVDLSTEYDDKKRKDVTVNGIINILQKYKFTIAENTPVEEDIALDPELLGRVFENLLASYNPETKTNARKQTGSFYTPRPIVEYMVDESLKAYLKTKIASTTLSNQRSLSGVEMTEENTLDEKLDALIAYNELEPQFTAKEKRFILEALDGCRILDPACGSGAFPMGILQKLVYIIHKLDPENRNWKTIQADKIEDDASLTKEEKRTLMDDMNAVFDNNELDYARKLYLIENCIHGIDIQPIATQISRLRFFISLIVDQNVDRNKNNFGIRPLPNLENRFVTANSLIGLDGGNVLTSKRTEELMSELQKVRHELFKAKTPKYKKALREKDKEIREELKNEFLLSGFGEKNAAALSSWNPYDKNKSADFFDAEWMFGIKDGFDIVIGNPPYIQLQANKGALANLYKNAGYKTFFKTGDIYCLFIERGCQLLKENGILSFINPNTWLQSISFSPFRKFVTTHFEWKSIALTNKVFEAATVDTHCICFRKSNKQGCCNIVRLEKNTMPIFLHAIEKQFISDTENVINIEVSPQRRAIIEKIQAKSKPLSDFFDIYNGVKPFEKGKGKPAQTAETMKTKPFVKEGEKPSEEWSPLLRGSFIGRYENKWNNNYWILYGEWLAAPRDKKIFDAPQKIVVRQTGDSIIATEIGSGIICRDNLHICIPRENINLSFALGLMNSKLTDFYYEFINPEKGEALAQVKKDHVVQLPIPQATAEQQKPIIALVDKIIAAKKANPQADTSKEEAEFDCLVYALYGLSEDEIKIVEGR